MCFELRSTIFMYQAASCLVCLTQNLSLVSSGLIMIGVIIASRKVGINPDNVATPIAASLGDLITLSLLAGISTGLYKELGTQHKHTHTLRSSHQSHRMFSGSSAVVMTH